MVYRIVVRLGLRPAYRTMDANWLETQDETSHPQPPGLIKGGAALLAAPAILGASRAGRRGPRSRSAMSRPRPAPRRAANCEIVTGNMIPPDLATFWAQAAQQGLNPKVVTLGKARLFPSIIETLGPRGDGLTSEIWWMPSRPFAFCLTGRSAKDLASAYTAATGRPWTQVPGFIHALLELSMGVIKRTVALDVAAAELPGVLGPNGAGKTTLFKAFSGIPCAQGASASRAGLWAGWPRRASPRRVRPWCRKGGGCFARFRPRRT